MGITLLLLGIIGTIVYYREWNKVSKKTSNFYGLDRMTPVQAELRRSLLPGWLTPFGALSFVLVVVGIILMLAGI